MEKHKFLFKACIMGRKKDLIVAAPVESHNVVTNEYCPQELLTGGLPFVTAINGESVDEFINDCNTQVNAMSQIPTAASIMDAHVGGLMAAIASHINRCGRLIFGDLLIYVDCFSLLLAADGIGDKEIRHVYPRIVRTVVDRYPNHIKNSADLSPFKGSHLDVVLYSLT